MKPIVFLGPTLSHEEAKKILDAVYLPPIRHADLISIVKNAQPRAVGIIDGAYGNVQSVWHKEILHALDSGVRVYGAAGIGALRAVETADVGMIGIGRIYGMFDSGELSDDDEVVEAYGDEASGYARRSEPMVNLRATFQSLMEKGFTDEATCNVLTGIAKSLFYPERTFENIFRKAKASGISEDTLKQLESLVREHYVDVKKQDAVELLQTIRDDSDSLSEGKAEVPRARGMLFNALYQRDRRVQSDGTEVPLLAVAGCAALHAPDSAEINFHALNRALVQLLAELLDVKVSQEQTEKEAQRFRMKTYLREEDDFRAWLQANHLSQSEFEDLMREVACCRTLHRWMMTSKKHIEHNTKFFLDELRLRNQYERWVAEAAHQQRVLDEHYVGLQEISPDGTDMREMVIEHLHSSDLRLDTHYTEWATEMGFSPATFLLSLLRSRMVRNLSEDQNGLW